MIRPRIRAQLTGSKLVKIIIKANKSARNILMRKSPISLKHESNMNEHLSSAIIHTSDMT